MDLSNLLRELQYRKAKCEEAIALIESLQKLAGQRDFSLDELHVTAKIGIRGRKFMGDDERRLVSARMKAYWAKRRDGTDEAADEPAPRNAAGQNSGDAEQEMTDSQPPYQHVEGVLVSSQ
jgi:hypothetical protein